MPLPHLVEVGPRDRGRGGLPLSMPSHRTGVSLKSLWSCAKPILLPFTLGAPMPYSLSSHSPSLSREVAILFDGL